MSAQPPQFRHPRRSQPNQLNQLKKKASVFLLSAFVLVETAPVLDRVFSPATDDGLFAAQPSAGVSYEFAVEPSGVIRSSCAEGTSRIELAPSEKTVRTADGLFREVSVQASLCTDFGFRKRQSTFYMPAELFHADSEVIQGTWETKTYTGVPSSIRPEETSTLQVRKLQDGRLEVASLPKAFEQPEFQPVWLSFNSTDEMTPIQNWHAGLLPLKDIRFEYEHPFLAKSIVLQGKLNKVRVISRPLAQAF